MERTDLESVWKRIEAGLASEQERIDAAALSGKLGRTFYVPRLEELLKDRADQVRYFALQSLILDLDQLTPDLEHTCWNFLQTDLSRDVRRMAATCLGKFLYRRRSAESFNRLIGMLSDQRQPIDVRGAIYRAIHHAAGVPGAVGSARIFREAEIDWSRISELQKLYAADA